jgi:hypothetical protein
MSPFDVAIEMIMSGRERHEDGRTVQRVLADAILEAPLETLTALMGMLDEMDKADDAMGLPSEGATHTGKAGVPS